MQHISLTYQKSLISDNCFQPEGTPSDAASGSMAILIVFLSDEQHTTIQHIHLSFMVHHIGCNIYDQDGILSCINSIEEDLKKARQKRDAGKDPGRVRSYAMLVANFGGIMAVPMDPPYCLVYPGIYSDDIATKNQNHFNTAGSPPGHESSGSSESGSKEATDNEGDQQNGSDNEGKGSGNEMEGSDAGDSSSPSPSDHAESPPEASPPVKKAPEVNLNTSQMLSLPDLDSKDLEEEQKTK